MELKTFKEIKKHLEYYEYLTPQDSGMAVCTPDDFGRILEAFLPYSIVPPQFTHYESENDIQDDERKVDFIVVDVNRLDNKNYSLARLFGFLKPTGVLVIHYSSPNTFIEILNESPELVFWNAFFFNPKENYIGVKKHAN